MSRVYEALKKAEQETGDAFVNEDPAAVPGEIRLDKSALLADMLTRSNEEFSTESLCFEELIKRCSKANWKPNSHRSFLLNSEEGLGGSERFRMLRSRLYQTRSSRKLSSLLVTSALAGEGKTYIASNLALIIARQPGTKVLLLDANTRCPGLHFALGAPCSPGLTEYLSEKASLEEILQHGKQWNLCFIASGRPVANPGELLAGLRMKKLLDRICPTFDWIIIDSPPVLVSSDPIVLADMVDGVLQVVAAGTTDREDARRASREFKDSKLLGVVLNYDARSTLKYRNVPHRNNDDKNDDHI